MPDREIVTDSEAAAIEDFLVRLPTAAPLTAEARRHLERLLEDRRIRKAAATPTLDN